VLDEIITTGPPVRYPSTSQRQPAARWTQTIPIAAGPPSHRRDRTEILLLELLDAASERDEAEQPWIMGPNAPKLRDRPVALGTAVYRR